MFHAVAHGRIEHLYSNLRNGLELKAKRILIIHYWRKG